MGELKKNTKVVEFIKTKYGKFDDDTLKEFFLSDFYVSSSWKKLPEDAYDEFKFELDRLLEFQGLSYEDLKFLGAGQTFSGLLVGDAVVKVGSKQYPVYSLPYRLNPIYKKELSGNCDLFVSRAAETKGISKKEVQDMYNRVRADGGIWLDVKEENLGRVKNSRFNFEELYGKDNLYKCEEFDCKLSDYSDDVFLIDYEDVVFITPEIRSKIIAMEPVNINSIKREIVRDHDDLDDVYFEGYISNSNKLLEYEERYQRSVGNQDKAERCVKKKRDNDKAFAQREYEIDQCYRHGRHLNQIGKKYSVKEIAIRAMQNTSFLGFRNIVNEVKYNMIRIYYTIKDKQRSRNTNTNNVKQDAGSIEEMMIEDIQFDDSTIVFDIGNEQRKDEHNGENNLQDMFDPYTTR